MQMCINMLIYSPELSQLLIFSGLDMQPIWSTENASYATTAGYKLTLCQLMLGLSVLKVTLFLLLKV